MGVSTPAPYFKYSLEFRKTSKTLVWPHVKKPSGELKFTHGGLQITRIQGRNVVPTFKVKTQTTTVPGPPWITVPFALVWGCLPGSMGKFTEN